jgi:hypothetical protein
MLGLLAGALLFLRVHVLTVMEMKANRQLLVLQVRPGDRFVLSYRHSVTQGRVSGTFAIEADGSLVVKETAFATPGPGLPEPRPGDEYEISAGLIRHRPRGERLPELSVFVHPFTEHALVLQGKSLDLSREVRPGALVKIHVERQVFWWPWLQKMGAVLSRPR